MGDADRVPSWKIRTPFGVVEVSIPFVVSLAIVLIVFAGFPAMSPPVERGSGIGVRTFAGATAEVVLPPATQVVVPATAVPPTQVPPTLTTLPGYRVLAVDVTSDQAGWSPGQVGVALDAGTLYLPLERRGIYCQIQLPPGDDASVEPAAPWVLCSVLGGE